HHDRVPHQQKRNQTTKKHHVKPGSSGCPLSTADQPRPPTTPAHGFASLPCRGRYPPPVCGVAHPWATHNKLGPSCKSRPFQLPPAIHAGRSRLIGPSRADTERKGRWKGTPTHAPPRLTIL